MLTLSNVPARRALVLALAVLAALAVVLTVLGLAHGTAVHLGAVTRPLMYYHD